MVQEGERLSLGKRDKPDRELRQLDGEGIDVDAVYTTLRNQPPSDNNSFILGCWKRIGVPEFIKDFPLRRDELAHRAAFAPCFDESLGQVPTCLNEEGTRPHCWVTHFDV